ncbi:hypothetical protein BC936DRAFT_138123, partial [Jimgerdemannia flammicorona]
MSQAGVRIPLDETIAKGVVPKPASRPCLDLRRIDDDLAIACQTVDAIVPEIYNNHLWTPEFTWGPLAGGVRNLGRHNPHPDLMLR